MDIVEGTPLDHENAVASQVARSPEFALAEASTSVLAVVFDRLTALPAADDESVRVRRTALLASSACARSEASAAA
jgi:hypothetical protein